MCKMMESTGARSTRAAVVLLIVLCTVAVSGNPPHSANSWVWGRRNIAQSAASEQLVDNVPQQSIVQRRHGRVIRPSVRDTTAFFKSIGARSASLRPTPAPFNVLNTQEKFKKHHKTTASPSIKPSPIDTNFESHFDVISAKDVGMFPEDIKKLPQPKYITTPQLPLITPTIITPGEYPFPFGSKPIDLGDGTSIGWAPEDTLLVENEPTKKQQTKPEFVQQENEDARYTTLDKLFDSREPTNLPDTHSLSNDVLGGLHPDEVFYADKDLIIIKGGGFSTTSSIHSNDITNNIDDSIKQTSSGAKTLTDVEHRQLPLHFFNGNIPTIVKSSSTHYNSHESDRRLRPAQSHGFRPIHQASFIPIIPQRSRYSFHSSASNRLNIQSTNEEQNYQSLNENEPMIALPSRQHSVIVAPPVKRSTTSNNKVVQYHYQTRGNNLPIVDYKIHKNGKIETGTTVSRKNKNDFPNNIPASEKVSSADNAKSEQENHNNNNSNDQANESFHELEDLSAPEGASLVPKTQVPKKRPTTARPSVAPTASFKPSVQLPPNYRPSMPPQQGTRPHFSNGAAHQPQRPVSLAGDTRVNFLPPRPPINHQAEFLLRAPAVIPLNNIRPSLVSTRAVQAQPSPTQILVAAPHQPIFPAHHQFPPNLSPHQVSPHQVSPHVHRLTPQVHRLHPQVWQQRPQQVHRGVQHSIPQQHLQPQGRQRFMEPRRRQPLRQRQTPRI